MDLHHLGHSCLLVGTERARILVDPGNLSTDWHGAEDLDVIVVTHFHPDHIDLKHLEPLLDANPGVRVLADRGTVEELGQRGLEVTVLRPGAQHTFGDLELGPVGGDHAVIHPGIPRIPNVGVVIAEEEGPRLFHPGDSHDAVPGGIDVLALPLAAPWTSMAATANFGRGISPERFVPIHDRLLSEAGRAIHLRLADQLIRGQLLDLSENGPTRL